jgi:hypothetical protein
MRNVHKDDDRLSWSTYDILTEVDMIPAANGTKYPVTASPAEVAVFEPHMESFDIIIDKGTLDAILVEGSVCSMLANIHDLLKGSGIYFNCSLFSSDFVASLLKTPSLGFQVKQYQMVASDSSSVEQTEGNIFICKKRVGHSVDRELLSEEETFIMHNHFQSECPLLTAEKENQIQEYFRSSSSTGYLTLSETYALVFGDDMASLGYTSKLFMEDIQDFSLSKEGMMNVEEVVSFLKSKQ